MVLYLSLAVSAGRKQFLNNVPFFLGWSCMIWNQRFGTISFQWRQFVDHIPNFLHKGLFFYFFFFILPLFLTCSFLSLLTATLFIHFLVKWGTTEYKRFPSLKHFHFFKRNVFLSFFYLFDLCYLHPRNFSPTVSLPLSLSLHSLTTRLLFFFPL